jgi:predicted RNA-binding protein YlxR (DUF448 family)
MTKQVKKKSKNKKVPMRTCVGCRESKPKGELVRMVNDNGKVLVDITGKANGRGIYLCNDGNCFDKAIKRKAINRGLEISLTNEQVDQLSKDLFGNE